METPQLYRDLWPGSRRRILVVDDDPTLRLLLRVTLAADEFEIEEVASAEEAREVARFWRPAVVLLDVQLPGLDGLSFCRQLMAREDPPAVVLLTGTATPAAEAQRAGARAILHKPFSPLELIALIDGLDETPTEWLVSNSEGDAEQLLVYARDLSRIVEVERSQRRLLQHAYRQTVAALADALEAKDPGTGLHAQRVQHYAVTLTEMVEPRLLDDTSLEYGFLLHDVGKILGARIFALADALDAMTSDRPYRTALSWEQATDEILSHDGSQFDPKVVRAFCTRERQLHRIYEEFSAVAA